MMTVGFKARVTKQDYVSYIRRVLGITLTVKDSQFATIVIYNDSLAASEHVMTLKKEKIFGYIACQTIIWERYSGEWQISQIFPCENTEVIFHRAFDRTK